MLDTSKKAVCQEVEDYLKLHTDDLLKKGCRNKLMNIKFKVINAVGTAQCEMKGPYQYTIRIWTQDETGRQRSLYEINGLAFHEIGHILFTFNGMDPNKLKEMHPRKAHTVHNIIEDRYVEDRMVMQESRREGFCYCLNKIRQDSIEQMPEPDPIGIYWGLKKDTLTAWYRFVNTGEENIVITEEIKDLYESYFSPDNKKAKYLPGRYAIAAEIYDFLFSDDNPARQEENKPKPKEDDTEDHDQSQGQDSDDQDQSQGQDDDDVDQDSDGDQDDDDDQDSSDQDGDGDDEDEDDDQGDSDSDDHDGDSDQDDSDSDEDNQGKDDDQDDDQGGDGDEDDEDDDQGDSDSDDHDGDSDQDDSDSDQDGEDQDSSDQDNEDDEDDDQGDSDSDDHDGDSDQDDSDSDQDNQGQDDDQDDDQGGDGDEDVDQDDDVNEDDQGQDVDQDDDQDGDGDEDGDQDDQDDDISDEAIEDALSRLEEFMNKEGEEMEDMYNALPKGKFMAGTVTLDKDAFFAEESFGRDFDLPERHAKRIVKKLRPLFEEQDRSLASGHRAGPRIDVRQSLKGRADCFYKKGKPAEMPDAAIVIVCDVSGSMGFTATPEKSRLDVCLETGYMLYYVCQELGIPAGIYLESYVVEPDEPPPEDTKINPIAHMGNMARAKEVKKRLDRVKTAGGNCDGARIKFGAELLLTQPRQTRKILINISDGAPTGSVERGFKTSGADPQAMEAAEFCRENGIIYIALPAFHSKESYSGMRSLRKLYGANFVEKDIDQLPVALAEFLKKEIVKSKRQAR